MLHSIVLELIQRNVVLLEEKSIEVFRARNDDPVFESYHRDFNVAYDRVSYAILLRMLENLHFYGEF